MPRAKKKSTAKRRGALPSSNGPPGDLENTYYDPAHPAGYGTATKLQLATKKKPDEIQHFLQGQDSHTLHYPVRKNFARNRVVATTIDHTWGVDLTDFSSIASENSGYCWVLCCIDSFSKYGFTQCLKSKKSDEVLSGLKAIFSRTERRPATIICDNGGEFFKFKSFLSKEGIQFYTTHNPDIKVSFCERWQLSLKIKLFKAFTHRQSYRYCDGLLDSIVTSYNNTYHRSIRMRPVDVTHERVLEVYRNLYGYPLQLRPQKPKLKVGQVVRITREMGQFEKSVYGGWSEELYKIIQVIPHTVPVYRLALLLTGEEIIGNFYPNEVQAVRAPEGDK